MWLRGLIVVLVLISSAWSALPEGVRESTPVVLGQPVSFTIEPKDAVRWCKVLPPTDGILRWTVADWPADGPAGGPAVTYYDGAGRGLPMGGGEARVTKQVPVYVAVRSHANAGSQVAIPTAFAIRFFVDAEPDESEPNGSLETARRITLGQPVTLGLRPLYDEDVLQFEVPKVGTATVRMIEGPKEFWPYIQHVDAAGKVVGSGIASARVLPGKAYIALRSSRFRHRDQVVPSFTIQVDFVPETDASEPNDSLETARPVALDKPVALGIQPRLDEDVFALDLPAAGVVTARLLEGPEGFWPYLEFVTPNREIVAAGEADARLPAGRAYVIVRSARFSTDRREIPAFSLQFDFLQETDASEPNESPESARPIALGEAFTLALRPRLDVDTLRVTVPTVGVLRWSGLRDGKPYRPYVTLATADKLVVAAGETAAMVEPGTYYAVVQHARFTSDLRVVDDITMTFTLDMADDPNEPNNELESARVIAFGATRPMTFQPRLDADWFRLESRRPGIAVLSVEGYTGSTGPHATWCDAERLILGSGTSSARIPASGVLYLLLRSSEYDASSVAVETSFRTTVRFVPEWDDTEPNDRPTTARRARLGADHPLSFMPAGDADFFVLELPQAGILRAQTAGWPEDVRPAIRFVGADAKTIVSSDWDVRLPAGRVYAELTAAAYTAKRRMVTERGSVRFDLLRDPDLAEPANDAYETAPALKPGGSATTWLMPASDVDCYRIRVDQPMSLTPKVDPELVKRLGLQLVIFDDEERICPPGTVLSPGEYGLQVARPAATAGARERIFFTLVATAANETVLPAPEPSGRARRWSFTIRKVE